MAWFRRNRAGTSAATAPAATAPAVEQDPGSGGFFRRFGGRRHRVGIPYVLPTDLGEINRLDFQHYMLRFALRGNYGAPVQQPGAILDVGGGTGRWSVELASVFPQAQIVSLDLSDPSAPGGALTGAPIPPNVTFQVANVLEGLPYPDAAFDFVHQRLLAFALPLDRWPDDVRELVRVTRAGGWVELVEGRPAVHVQTPALATLHQWVLDFCTRRNIDPLVGNQIDGFLRQAGLDRVTMREVRLPLGRGGGHLGTMAETDYFTGFAALRPILVAQGITTGEAFDEMMRAARIEMDMGSYEWSFYIAYGQRGALHRAAREPGGQRRTWRAPRRSADCRG